jgi:hypothetical protein
MRTTKSKWLIAAATVVLSVAAFEPAAARSYCAHYTDGGTNCGFRTMAQCLAAVSGAGGSCSINPRSVARRARHY